MRQAMSSAAITAPMLLADSTSRPPIDTCNPLGRLTEGRGMEATSAPYAVRLAFPEDQGDDRRADRHDRHQDGDAEPALVEPVRRAGHRPGDGGERHRAGEEVDDEVCRACRTVALTDAAARHVEPAQPVRHEVDDERDVPGAERHGREPASDGERTTAH